MCFYLFCRKVDLEKNLSIYGIQFKIKIDWILIEKKDNNKLKERRIRKKEGLQKQITDLGRRRRKHKTSCTIMGPTQFIYFLFQLYLVFNSVSFL